MLFTKQSFKQLALQARIWTAPRAHFDHVLVLRLEGNTLLLADKRASSLLPPALRLAPPAGLKHLPSPSPGLSCTAVYVLHFVLTTNMLIELSQMSGCESNLRPWCV
jgi:hypothetical protein